MAFDLPIRADWEQTVVAIKRQLAKKLVLQKQFLLFLKVFLHLKFALLWSQLTSLQYSLKIPLSKLIQPHASQGEKFLNPKL